MGGVRLARLRPLPCFEPVGVGPAQPALCVPGRWLIKVDGVARCESDESLSPFSRRRR